MNDAVRSCTKKRMMENESSMPQTHSPGDDVFGLLAADLEVEDRSLQASVQRRPAALARSSWVCPSSAPCVAASRGAVPDPPVPGRLVHLVVHREAALAVDARPGALQGCAAGDKAAAHGAEAVSYTHLTLPTIYSV